MKSSLKTMAFGLLLAAAPMAAQNNTETFPLTQTVVANPGLYALTPLAYQFADFNDKIDAKTMHTHYAKHYVAYTNNLNKILADKNISQNNIEQLILSLDPKDAPLRNNAGGYYNHSLYFQAFSKTPNQDISPAFAAAMQRDFGGFDKFLEQFQQAGATFFGSGWVWLVLDEQQKLKIITTINQDSPQMQHLNPKHQPLLALDVWEHAYYLKYLNKKADYIKAFMQVLDWQSLSKTYQQKLK
jgi:superoxide dismutase, Fe-Mn family